MVSKTVTFFMVSICSTIVSAVVGLISVLEGLDFPPLFFIPNIKTINTEAKTTFSIGKNCFLSSSLYILKSTANNPTEMIFLITACRGVIGNKLPKQPQLPVFPTVKISIVR